ncbi:hypothetical protein ACFLRA_00745 [Bdellovibrionota bacterium]
MFLRAIFYVILGMIMFVGPTFKYSIPHMVAFMREKAIQKAGEPWAELCFDWSGNTRMPMEDRIAWKKKYKACRERNIKRNKAYWSSIKN